jgi:hypothetical protein
MLVTVQTPSSTGPDLTVHVNQVQMYLFRSQRAEKSNLQSGTFAPKFKFLDETIAL